MTIQSNFEKNICTENEATIVIATRDSDSQAHMTPVLEALKLEYYLTDNGKTALDLVYQKKPNLVLLDVVMPYLNGIEVNILIKNDLFTNTIPTIALTRLTEPNHIKTLFEAGFDDYAIEPLTDEDLENMVKRFINKKSNAFAKKRKILL